MSVKITIKKKTQKYRIERNRIKEPKKKEKEREIKRRLRELELENELTGNILSDTFVKGPPLTATLVPQKQRDQQVNQKIKKLKSKKFRVTSNEACLLLLPRPSCEHTSELHHLHPAHHRQSHKQHKTP